MNLLQALCRWLHLRRCSYCRGLTPIPKERWGSRKLRQAYIDLLRQGKIHRGDWHG